MEEVVKEIMKIAEINEDTSVNEVESVIAEPSEQEEMDVAVTTGRNCRINIADKHEIVRLNQELQEIKHWFEDYGRNGLLFPNSIINGYFQYSQAA